MSRMYLLIKTISDATKKISDGCLRKKNVDLDEKFGSVDNRIRECLENQLKDDITKLVKLVTDITLPFPPPPEKN